MGVTETESPLSKADTTALSAQTIAQTSTTGSRMRKDYPSNANNVVSFPIVADADKFAAIPVLNEPVIFDETKPGQPKTAGLSFVVTLVTGILLLGLIAALSSPQVIHYVTGQTQSTPPGHALVTDLVTDNVRALQNIAEQIKHDGVWSDERLTSLMQSWAELDLGTKRALTKQAWYLNFVDLLQQQADQLIQANSNHAINIENNTLIKVAVILGVVTQHEIAAKRTKKTENYNQLVRAIKSDIAKVEKSIKTRHP